MVIQEIPNWNEIGVIPPMDMEHPTSAYRSPYKTDILKFVERYATSPQRIEILLGFIKFRKEINKTGLTDGFQWIDGSFIEDVELIEKRPPNDIDVVTFLIWRLTKRSKMSLCVTRICLCHIWVSGESKSLELILTSSHWAFLRNSL